MPPARHAHHWRIDSPRPGQAMVTGCCKVCGATRSFPAFEPSEVFSSTSSKKVVRCANCGDPLRRSSAKYCGASPCQQAKVAAWKRARARAETA